MLKVFAWLADFFKREQQLLPGPRVPAALPDISGGAPNLMPVDALSTPLRVEVPQWLNSNPSEEHPEYLKLFWNGAEVANKRFTAPLSAEDLFADIPVHHLVENTHQLHYEVINWAENPFQSDPITVTIDLTPPISGQPPALVFPAGANPITARYLLENEDQVVAEVSGYVPELADKVVYYWETNPNGNLELGTRELTAEDLDKPVQVIFTGDELRRLDNGERWATYRLMDRAGNRTELSGNVRMRVEIAPPEPRLHPTVNEAQSNGASGTLDPLRALAGASVTVPTQQDERPGDELRVQWQGNNDHDSVVVDTPETGDHLFKIGPGIVAASMDSTVEVTYWVTWPGLEAEQSQIYRLAVGKIASIRYPTISCEQVGSGSTQLRLSNVPASGADLRLDAWVFKRDALAQRLTVVVSGIGLEGEVKIADAIPVATGNSPASIKLPREVLQRITPDTIFNISVRVSFNDGASFHEFPFLDLKLVS